MDALFDVTPALLAHRLASGLFIKGTVLLGGAWLVAACLRHRAASTRYAVWTAAFAALLVLPIATSVAPKWNLTPARPLTAVSSTPDQVSFTQPSVSATTTAIGETASHHMSDGFIAAATPARSRSGTRLPLLVLGVWGAGVVLGLGFLAVGALRVRGLRRHVLALEPDDPTAVLAREIGRDLGLRRPVIVALSADLTIPINWGLRRPIVLLPVESLEWPPDRLRVVLLHELAHIHRLDYVPHLAMQLARAIYWPNPLVWFAARHAGAEQERACDDVVLSRGTRAPDYARHLVDIARLVASGNAQLGGALAMAGGSGLAGRVAAILARGLDRGALGRRTTIAVALGATLAALPVAAVRLVGEGRERLVEREALSRLESPDAAERAQAAWVLGNAGSRRALAPLTAALTDIDPQVRGVAAWALGETADRAATAPLLTTLQDPDAYVREMAVFALGTIGDRRVVFALAPLTLDPEMGVRGVLTEALQRLGGDDAARLLAEIARHDSDPHARAMAVNNLRLTDRDLALETLLEMVASPDPNTRTTAMYSLAELADYRAIPALTAVVSHDSLPRLRGAAAWALGRTNDIRGIDGVLVAMHDSDFGVRVSAAYALGALGGPRAVSALLAATRDPVHQVRLASVESLEEIRHR